MRMGTVDILLTLLALVCEKQRARGKGVGINTGAIYDILFQLKNNPVFTPLLAYLDFTCVGESAYSEAVENFLFMSGVTHLHDSYFVAGHEILVVEETRAHSRLQKMRQEFGEPAITRVDALADEFLRYYDSNQAPCSA